MRIILILYLIPFLSTNEDKLIADSEYFTNRGSLAFMAAMKSNKKDSFRFFFIIIIK